MYAHIDAVCNLGWSERCVFPAGLGKTLARSAPWLAGCLMKLWRHKDLYNVGPCRFINIHKPHWRKSLVLSLINQSHWSYKPTWLSGGAPHCRIADLQIVVIWHLPPHAKIQLYHTTGHRQQLVPNYKGWLRYFSWYGCSMLNIFVVCALFLSYIMTCVSCMQKLQIQEYRWSDGGARFDFGKCSPFIYFPQFSTT